MADVTLRRGIRDPLTGKFSHLHDMTLKDIQLGVIGCASQCLSCDSADYCILCTNYADEYVSNGKCYSECPPETPYFQFFDAISNF